MINPTTTTDQTGCRLHTYLFFFVTISIYLHLSFNTFPKKKCPANTEPMKFLVLRFGVKEPKLITKKQQPPFSHKLKAHNQSLERTHSLTKIARLPGNNFFSVAFQPTETKILPVFFFLTSNSHNALYDPQLS